MNYWFCIVFLIFSILFLGDIVLCNGFPSINVCDSKNVCVCSYVDPEAVVGCEDGKARVFDMYSRRWSRIIKYADPWFYITVSLHLVLLLSTRRRRKWEEKWGEWMEKELRGNRNGKMWNEDVKFLDNWNEKKQNRKLRGKDAKVGKKGKY